MDAHSDDEFDHVRDFDMSDIEFDEENENDTPSTTPPRLGTPASSGRKIITCPYEGCPKTFNRNARLQEHIRSHTGERPFKCSHQGCGKAFLRDSHLKHHLTSAHSNIRNYKCTWEGCDKSFATGTRLRRHLQSHQGREKHRCRGYDGCNETFRKHETLRRHILAIHENKKPFPCGQTLASGAYCDQAFDSAEKLRSHQRSLHDPTKFTCTVCSAQLTPEDDGHSSLDDSHTFQTWHELQEHIQKAHLATCDQCAQSFNSNKDLVRHLENVHAISHSISGTSKTFPCSYAGCDHVFTKRGNLNVHIKTVHEKKKDFVCGRTEVPLPDEIDRSLHPVIQGCGRSFTSKASLVEHVRVAHFHLKTKRQQREEKKRLKRQAESDPTSPLTTKRRLPRKDKGTKKTSTLASLSGLEPQLRATAELTSLPQFNYSESPSFGDSMDEEPDDWNQLSGSMTLFGEHLYHNGQGYHLVSEDGSADSIKLDDAQYMPCHDPKVDGFNPAENMDTEPFFDFEHEREHIRNIDPMLQYA